MEATCGVAVYLIKVYMIRGTAIQNLPSQLFHRITHEYMQLIESPLVSATMAPLVHA